MPLSGQQTTVTPFAGVQALKLWPHPDDLAEIASRLAAGNHPKADAEAALRATLDASQEALLDAYIAAKVVDLSDYTPKSVCAFLYGKYNSEADYQAEPAGQFPSGGVDSTGYFGATGDAVRGIVEMTPFHGAASGVSAGLLSGSTTVDTFGVEKAQRALKGLAADFQFGTTPFTVPDPDAPE